MDNSTFQFNVPINVQFSIKMVQFKDSHPPQRFCIFVIKLFNKFMFQFERVFQARCVLGVLVESAPNPNIQTATTTGIVHKDMSNHQ